MSLPIATRRRPASLTTLLATTKPPFFPGSLPPLSCPDEPAILVVIVGPARILRIEPVGHKSIADDVPGRANVEAERDVVTDAAPGRLGLR